MPKNKSHTSSTQPNKSLIEIIPNQWPNADYEISLICEEFTCLCPVTGKPDFAAIYISYVPNDHIVEIMSLKSYLSSFRNTTIFQEFAINQICDDLSFILDPKSIEVRGEFAARGGIRIIPTARN